MEGLITTVPTILWGAALLFAFLASWNLYQRYVGNTTKDTATRSGLMILACLAGIIYFNYGQDLLVGLVTAGSLITGLVFLGMGVYDKVRLGQSPWKNIRTGSLLILVALILVGITGEAMWPRTVIDRIVVYGIARGWLFLVSTLVFGAITVIRRRRGQPGGQPANLAAISLIIFIALQYFIRM